MALASATGIMLGLSLRSSNANIRQLAWQAAKLSREKAQSDPFWYATHILALIDIKQP